MTVFVGCGFAAKYREGGGNFSVPLQWMLGLQRLGKDAVWLEYLPGTGNGPSDAANIRNFQQRLREHGLAGQYCVLFDRSPNDAHDLDRMECVGLSKKQLRDRLAGPNILLNLSYSIHPPFLSEFERRLFCDLDPSEIFYWMTKLDMGQTHHHEFWTIGLNANEPDCRLPETGLKWKTFYPLADTQLLQPQPRPRRMKFTTVGQWYWSGRVEVDGEYPDLSKKFAFEPYLSLPKKVPEAQFELAMNINADDPEQVRLKALGWKLVEPHRVTRTPRLYRRYLASAAAEFTAIKGVDVSWRTGWLSDRAAAFAALGRPVVTENSSAGKFLPRESGFHFVANADEAAEAARTIITDWSRESKRARHCAVEVFDSVRNLKRILGLE